MVLDSSERDVKVWNSQFLDKIGIDLMGKIAMEVQVWIWIGMARLVLRRMAMTES